MFICYLGSLVTLFMLNTKNLDGGEKIIAFVIVPAAVPIVAIITAIVELPWKKINNYYTKGAKEERKVQARADRLRNSEII